MDFPSAEQIRTTIEGRKQGKISREQKDALTQVIHLLMKADNWPICVVISGEQYTLFTRHINFLREKALLNTDWKSLSVEIESNRIHQGYVLKAE